MPSQVDAHGHMTEPQLSMNPLSGGYPSSQISNVARSPYPFGLYSNHEASCYPRDNVGSNRTYGDIEAYRNPVLGSHYRPSTAGNSNMGFPGRSYVDYRESQPFNYSTYGRPYVEYRDFQPEFLSPAAGTPSLPPYGEPTIRPQHGGLPDNVQYSGRYACQYPKYNYP
ncbi:uncharacterized protein LOC131622779 [Vicia villosa]|uniref:uncharacterized protein LOC131622779 n=1 Tax=Vicia villosa TaxID=3911 RepID=UPI00273AE655|nr:uncharacterized protein LOC131622779 [Vicia villosa]